VTGVASPPDPGSERSTDLGRSGRGSGAGGAVPTGRTRRDPWHRWLAATVALVVALAAVLVWWGSEAILSSTDGNLLRTVDDPAQPGFEALVEPTPVLAVIGLDGDGALASVSLLSLTGSGAGAVIVAPPGTLVPGDGAGRPTLADVWASDGGVGVRRELGGILNVGIGEDRVVDPGQWASLLGPVAPLAVDNADVFVAESAGGDTLRLPAGEVELEPTEVPVYLGPSSTGESELARLIRLERFWASWITAVGDGVAVPGIVPGEASTGLGRFMRALAGVEVELAALPVVPVERPDGGEDFEPVGDEVAALVSRLVPFPVGATPNSRLRVRILDGTGQLDNGLPAAPDLVSAGAEVATVGNATRFDYVVTQFIVPPGVETVRVEVMRDRLGVGEVIASAESASAVDVTVVLGADAVDRLGGPYLPPTTSEGAADGG